MEKICRTELTAGSSLGRSAYMFPIRQAWSTEFEGIVRQKYPQTPTEGSTEYRGDRGTKR
jgi:hypothetical protein